jgi:hypothetical protein
VKLNINNLQITKSTRGVAMESGSLVQCRNFLFTDLTDGFYLTGTTTNRSEHGTMHRVTNYRSSTNGLFTLTNSLLISVTNNFVLHQSANVVTNVSDTGFFQTVGAATHYLASGSTNRDAGTTNINTTLLADLKKKTTYPPVVIGDGGYYTNTLTLYPQAQRDTDTPDIGYHYEPLDYVINGVTLTNASITAMPGVAMGIRTIYSTGFGLLGGSALYCEGTPDNLNRIVRYNMVQEQSNTNWTDYATSGAYNIGTSWSSTVNAPPASPENIATTRARMKRVIRFTVGGSLNESLGQGWRCAAGFARDAATALWPATGRAPSGVATIRKGSGVGQTPFRSSPDSGGCL